MNNCDNTLNSIVWVMGFSGLWDYVDYGGWGGSVYIGEILY